MTFIRFTSKPSCFINHVWRVQLNQKVMQKFCTLTEADINIISPDEVLSKSNREKCMKLFNSIKDVEFFKTKNLRNAAVLVPLSKIDNKLAVLYTERALHLKTNGGETAFPGGMFDESDGTLEQTALREAYEEIGLQPDKVDLWGKGPEIYRPDVKVTPVLGYIGNLKFQKFKLNANEVVSVFPVTLENLSSSKNFKITRFRAGKKSIFVTPVYLGGKKRIWGLTAYITHIVLSSLIPDTYKKRINFLPKIQTVINYRKKMGGAKNNAFMK